METKILKLNRSDFNEAVLTEAGQLLRNGELVAFPTETVYGLGGNALDSQASKKIYAAKGRPSDNPLIVHIADIKALQELAEEIPEEAYILAKEFWPGPMTMILKKKPIVPDSTTGGLQTVAIRMPSDEIARSLIRVSGVYIAAPSANLSGRPSPTTAEHVKEDMQGRIPMIIDGGACVIGLESSIIDLSGTQPTILRPGYITKEDMERVLSQVSYDKAAVGGKSDELTVAKAPGMKYKHYAPKADLTIIEGSREAVIGYINRETDRLEAEGICAGVLAASETVRAYHCRHVLDIGSRTNEDAIAAGLFAALRSFDELGAAVVFSESFEDNRLSQAIMNRLKKAAGYQILQVSKD